MPKCHLISQRKNGENAELKCLYEIANELAGISWRSGDLRQSLHNGVQGESYQPLMDESSSVLITGTIFHDHSEDSDYQSLHITFYDNSSRTLYGSAAPYQRLWMMWQKSAQPIIWDMKRSRRSERGKTGCNSEREECRYFDDAYERGIRLLNLDLSKLDVNMFAAVNNSLINDGCGLYRGRLILPYEHLSRFQNDLID